MIVNFLNSIKTAWRGLSVNKLRSGLTILGIMIGVGAVIAMISVGNGVTRSVTERIQSLGSNLLIIMPGSARETFGGPQQAAGTARTLTLEDAWAIEKEISVIELVSPEYSGSAQVVYSNKNINTRILGVVPEYQEVHNAHVAYGQFIRLEDDNARSRVAVLGQNVVSELFSTGEDPIGKTIKIKNIPFLIIGIMEAKGQAGFQNLDDQIFIPLSTAQKRLFGSSNLQSVSVKVRSEGEMDTAADQIGTLLLLRHKIENPENADFRIMNQADLLSTMTEVSATFTILLGGIAAISLLVGGIGIMNIMLVSVTERTREIGLRKAIGARRIDVLMQFLIESVVLSLLGGLMGILLGFSGSYVLSKVGDWPFVVTVNSVLLAFLFSAMVGVFFGIYPARRAAVLNPIEALRYE